MIKSKKKVNNKEKINFLLENKEFKKLHLIIYLFSVCLIVLVYFVSVVVFSKYFNILITALFSLFVGIYLVFNRDLLVKVISRHLEEKKRQRIKKENKLGLKTTLKHITPKRDIKLSIKGKTSFKDRMNNLKVKLIPKSKTNEQKKREDPDYLELK